MIHYRSAVGLQQEKLRQAAAIARPRRAGQRSTNPLGRLAGILAQLLASRATAGRALGDELTATSGIDDG
jgi:hypothetical protein